MTIPPRPALGFIGCIGIFDYSDDIYNIFIDYDIQINFQNKEDL